MAPKASKAPKASIEPSTAILAVCIACVEAHEGSIDPDLLGRENIGPMWLDLETRFNARIEAPDHPENPASRRKVHASCPCCHRKAGAFYLCSVRSHSRAKRVGKVKGPVKVESRSEPSTGKRVRWSERTFRVLSNPLATPKMHETRESAVAHGKRHLKAGRAPLVQTLVNGEWQDISDWADTSIPANTPYRW